MRRMIRLVMALACFCAYVVFALLVQLVNAAPWVAFLLGTVFIAVLLEVYDGFCYFLCKDEVYLIDCYEEK